MKKLSWLFVLLLTVTVTNYPNPFNPKGGQVATIEVTTDTNGSALLYIYDMAARRVFQTTFPLTAGATNRTTWSGYNEFNELAGNGVYLYRIIDASSKKSLAKGKIWVINK